ncbi:hypothetical protein J4226_00140 [Candidatus Pacearchaeota archaeon]|nr:hypothetical protein [Candidatus Pacearchaeota archaeon]
MVNKEKLCELANLISATTDYYTKYTEDITQELGVYLRETAITFSEEFQSLNQKDKKNLETMRNTTMTKLHSLADIIQN